jgi:predicted acyltransferase
MSVISRKLNPNRTLALDVFRGITISGMILVNNPGGSQSYAPLEHAAWHGWTPTDLVFPSFAFILGVAVSYSLANRRAKKEWAGLSLFDYILPILTFIMYIGKIMVQTGFLKHGLDPAITAWDLIFPVIFILSILLPQLERRACEKGGSLYLQVLHHGFLILATGFIWSFDPTNPGHFRILGVLQRLGLVYIFASLIVLNTDRRGQIIATAGLLGLYWALMKLVPVPGCGAGLLTRECNPAGYLDNILLRGHLYTPNWDPEGLLHTIPSIATGLLGCIAGDWLRAKKPIGERMAGLFVAGNILIVAGLCLNLYFPINKNLWSPTYVLFVGGIDMAALAICVWFIDFKGFKKQAAPLVAIGSNSIFVYLMSGFFIHYICLIPAGTQNGVAINAKQAFYNIFYGSWLSPCNASLALSLTYVAIWVGISMILYKKKVFIKI